MAKLSKKKFLSMSPSEIGRLNRDQARELLRGARQLFNAQESKFKKYESSVWSSALEKMEEYYSEKGKRPISKLKLNDARNELYRLQDFFESKTSTIPGARRVMAEQDRRIFGVNDSTGKPLQRMTLEERSNFWSAYNEFIQMNSESYVRNMGSNTIQQYLGQMIIDERGKKFVQRPGSKAVDMRLFQELKRRLEGEKFENWEMNDYEYADSSVLSTKRPY